MTQLNQTITSLDVALVLAIWLEKQGGDFYRQASAVAGDGSLKELFLWLAEEEGAHGLIYRQLYEQAQGEPFEGDELFGEYGHYIGHLVDEISPGFAVTGTDTTATLLEKALAFEERSLNYFREILVKFPGAERQMIESICREEQEHIDRLVQVAGL